MNRQEFEAQVAKKSPLSLIQFESLFGGIDDGNKAIAWRFMGLTPKQQFAVMQVKQKFPEATVEAVR